jgi:CMP-N-acetylneuraminic acid synthetase
VLQHAVEWLEQVDHYRVDIVVYLQPTDIFRKRTMIDEAVRRLLNDPELDTAFVAYSTHKNFWRQVEGRYVRLAPDIKPGPRQTREPVYREDTGLACASRGAVIKAGRRIGDRVAVIPTDDDLSSIDIHTEFDLWLAEQVLTEGGRLVND